LLPSLVFIFFSHTRRPPLLVAAKGVFTYYPLPTTLSI
jgi:hypothetical protein